MKRQKRSNDSIRTKFHYNTRSSSRHENRGTEDTSLSVTRLRKQDFDLLPIDLVMDILKLLPIKTLARFLCVSNLWSSIIRRKGFMKLFLAESSAKPGRLFFSFNHQKNCFIFSSLPAPTESSSLATTYHVTHPASETYRISSSCLHGLICYVNDSGSRLVVYNSISRRSVTLPEFEQGSVVSRHFLGYDPIDGVYKVLCMTRPSFLYYVLTLGNESSSWKMIENSPVHLPANSQIICINGLVYFEAYLYMDFSEITVMSFDVRCENFQFIKRPGGTDIHHLHGIFSTLIRYEGKLAIMGTEIPANGNVDLWVLEDAVKHKWLKKVFVLPDSWICLGEPISELSHQRHRSLNVTDAGEIILAPRSLRDSDSPYYVLCYDPKRNTVRKVVIEGIKGHELLQCKEEEICFILCIYSSQVESLLFL